MSSLEEELLSNKTLNDMSDIEGRKERIIGKLRINKSVTTNRYKENAEYGKKIVTMLHDRGDVELAEAFKEFHKDLLKLINDVRNRKI